MQRSTDHVLSTHTGSLPRPDDLAELLVARQEDAALDLAAFEERVRSATAEVVARQVELGIDVVSDGEMSKADYIDYTRERLTGFSGNVPAHEAFFFGDLVEFPELVEATYRDTHFRLPECVDEITYNGEEEVQRDIANLKAALAQVAAPEAFIPAASPGIVSMCFPNRHYKSYDEYVFALGAALNTEYRAIVDAGLLLQVDSPDLGFGADFHTWMWDEIESRGFAAIQALHVEALNVALEGIPVESVRMHLCWANYMGPHTHDLPLLEVLEPALKANVTAINFEGANPAHEHEWQVFEDFRLPDGKVIIPGVIDTKSQVVETPQLVAQRIARYANLVGKENVIAGTDCGFGTFVGLGTVHPKVAWLKVKALAEGAALASDELA